MENRMREAIDFKIERRIAVLGPSGKDWSLELNLVSWNGREPKLDLRPWDPSHERMGKGITLTRDEAARLRDALGEHLSSAPD